MQSICRCLALIVGFGLVLAAVPTRAADKADAETINKLIDKLSSGRFAEREKAHKALDEIGLPALEALKKAAESSDPETKRRAGELVEKFEKQVLGAKILAPTKIHLQFKDTPVADAVAQIQKKTGYNIVLQAAESLKDRKVTLDTGEVTFWEAFDQFCAKAGLVEGEASEGQFPPGVQPGIIQPGVIQPLPGRIRIQPLPANQPGGIKIQPLPARQIQIEQILPVVPEKKSETPAKPALKNALQADEAPAREQPAQAKPAPVPVPVQARAVQAIAKPVQVQLQPAVRPIRRPRWNPPGFVPEAGPIVLKDGKSEPVPTDYSGAVRIKAMDSTQMFGPAGTGELSVGLKVSPEPKLRWQQTVAVRIDKAIDDQGQTLTPAMMNDPANLGGVVHFANYGSAHQFIPVRLTKGEKASKELKELTGTLTAQVLATPETLISVDEVAKAAGKTVKGKDGGSIKVSSVQEQNGQIIVTCELNAPPGYVGLGNNPGFGGQIIQFAPALPVVPAPAPPPRKALPPQNDVPKLPGALQADEKPAPVQGKPIQVQAQAQVQIQVQQIQVGGGGVVQIGGFGGNFGGGSAGGLELLDADGKVIPCIGNNMIGRANAGGPIQFENQLVFQPQKDQKATKLVYRGSKSVNVEIPFSLKNVKVN